MDDGLSESERIVIDGIAIAVMPGSVEMQRDPVSDYQDMMDGGSREWQRMPHFAGVADYSDRYQFVFPYEFLEDEALSQLELIRVRGGVHLVTPWRKVPIVYTCLAGVQTYYLPRFRKHAPSVYADLAVGGKTVTTAEFPTTATLNGAALTVTYADGPTLTTPGAGGLVIARDPVTSGEKTDYIALMLGDTVVDGDELIVWTYLTFQTQLRSVPVLFRNVTENQTYTFVEV